jgi:hypothetical protein
VYYAGHDASDFIHVPLPHSVLTFDWGDEMRGGTLSGTNGRWLGMTFGYHQYPTWKGVAEMTAIGDLPPGDARTFLQEEGAYWAMVLPTDEKTAEVNVRVPIDLPVLGGVSLQWDLPMVYSTMAIFGALFDDSPYDGEFDDWGIPRFRVQVSRTIGPLSVAAEYVIPTKYLVVPGYPEGQHWGVLAGLTF